ELVDGLPVCFYRFLDGHVECESGGGGMIAATASVTREMLNEARNHCLRKSGPGSESEDLPPFVPVICDIVVESQRFAVSVDDEAEIDSPIAGARDIACGVWAGSRLAVYVFALGGGQHLVRTALVGCADEDVACTVAVRPCAEGITVNGHPMRVHRALPRSLLFVAGEGGSVLDACRECGNVACAADAPPGALPVAYASDESSEDEGDHPPPPPPPLGLGSVLRSSHNSSCNIGHVAPAGSQSPPVQSALRQRTLVTQQQRQRTSMEASEEMEVEDKSGRTSLAARAALALVSLAVFLPVRRLVIADDNSVGRWLSARTNALPVDRRPKKSVLALLVLALTAMAAWALGVALAGLLLGF
ncbi:hypothetical protein FBU31_005956, partial [Coemansia sp. 'formosensis']